MPTHLSVNVNKIATLRNARGKNRPDVLNTSLSIISFGAHGITVHPRPDQRHIRPDDVRILSQTLRPMPEIEFNVEGFPSLEFLQLIEETRPDQCTLVPDPPEALTSSAGWNVKQNLTLIESTAGKLHKLGIRSSFFVEPGRISKADIGALAQCGADRIELYTEAYAESFGSAQQNEILNRYIEVAHWATDAKLAINAGHDLDQKNLLHFLNEVPGVKEVSIGHALISEALFDGLEKTVHNYLEIIGKAHATTHR